MAKFPFQIVVALVCATLFGGPAVAQEQLDQEELDKSLIYRLQPSVEGAELLSVPREEVEEGLTYHYFHSGLNRWAWGFAKGDGGFEYAFGENTILPTSRFDLRLDEASQDQILNLRAPGLKDTLESVGRAPSVRLTSEGNWELLPFPVSERVYDLATSRRWEWHGKRRVAVSHTNGYMWDFANGKFQPLTVVPAACW